MNVLESANLRLPTQPRIHSLSGQTKSKWDLVSSGAQLQVLKYTQTDPIPIALKCYNPRTRNYVIAQKP